MQTVLSPSPRPSGKRPAVAGNPCTGLVKVIAVFFMLIDHSAILFFSSSPHYLFLRMLGRIALPLFAWGCVLGCEYTRCIWLYALRVFLSGVLFQFPYMPVMHHGWNYLNIFFTLSLGILGVAGLKDRRLYLRLTLPVLAVLAPCLVDFLTGASMDYSWKGVLLVLVLYLCRKDRGALCAGFFAFCLFWGAGTSQVNGLFGISLAWPAAFNSLLGPLTRLQFFAVLALPFLLIRPAFDFRVPKAISYLIYPAHLALLWAVGRIV